MGNVLVTSYTNPDLDGVSCAVAYAEFLSKTGKEATAAVFGELNDETKLVMAKFSIRPPQRGERIKSWDQEIVLVDVSSKFGLSDKIEPGKVVELIDHHKISMGDELKNAKLQVELVGAAATLIAERFRQGKVSISKESACLLYYAIISNTINLKNNVTTQRDKDMAIWLSERFDFEEGYSSELFRQKSKFKKQVEEVLWTELAINEFGGRRVGISQLEIVDSAEFIKDNKDKIRDMLKRGKDEKGLEFVFFTCIDIEKGENRFVVANRESRRLAEDVLKVGFREDTAKRAGIIMRKEIWPLVKEVMEKK